MIQPINYRPPAVYTAQKRHKKEDHLSADYEMLKFFRIDRGPYSISVSLLSLLAYAGIMAAAVLLFPIATSGLSLYFLHCVYILIGLIGAALGLWITLLIQMIILKRCKGGKIRIRFGLLIYLQAQNPIRKGAYIFSEIFSSLIPICLCSIFASLFWNSTTFVALAVLIFNFITNLPVYIFQWRQPKNSLFFHDGDLLLSVRYKQKTDAEQIKAET